MLGASPTVLDRRPLPAHEVVGGDEDAGLERQAEDDDGDSSAPFLAPEDAAAATAATPTIARVSATFDQNMANPSQPGGAVAGRTTG